MKKSFEKPIAELIRLSSDEIMGTGDNVLSGDIVDFPELPDAQSFTDYDVQSLSDYFN